MRAAAFFEEYEFRAWEKALIVFSILMCLGATYLYVTDYPLRRYLFHITDEGEREPVGKVGIKSGKLRRQFTGDAEFKSIDAQETLYNEDTVVTGSDGTATLTLDDGSSIELAPNTMVKLHFETGLTLGGISRAATVDVVSGQVKSAPKRMQIVVRPPARPQARETPKTAEVAVPKPSPVAIATPTPTPTPTVVPVKELVLVSPHPGTELSLGKDSPWSGKPVSFSWRISPPNRPVQVALAKLLPGGKRVEIFREATQDQDGRGAVSHTLTTPGSYQWEIRGENGEVLPGAKSSSASFVLDPEFDAIEMMEPLVGGETLASNQLRGHPLKNFDVTLRWKPYSGATQYRVAIKSRAGDSKPVLEKTVPGNQYVFNKDRVLTGGVFYQIYAPLKTGFVARSVQKPFVFTFLAPALVMPANHSRIDANALETQGDSVLLTWQKTNFTEWYEVEIATDAEFKAVISRQKLKENFLVFKSPQTAKYYWRVRSSSKSVVSPFSLPFDLSVAR